MQEYERKGVYLIVIGVYSWLMTQSQFTNCIEDTADDFPAQPFPN